jgi:hypothetical protein
MPERHAAGRPWPGWPLVVAYGLGVNSTALLVELARRRVRPELILFADTGGEKPETYAYLDVIRPWLARQGLPDVTVVRYRPTRAAYHTLEQQCLHTGTLPSLAYGGRSCSVKYKIRPQDRYVAAWPPARRCWAAGGKVVRAIGFDAGPADSRRHRFAEDGRHVYWYPLFEWGYDRPRCEEVIAAAGLPVPMRSACWYCPASRKQEIVWLQQHHPDLLERALRIERNAEAGLTTVKGLGRSFSWRAYLAGRDDHPLLGGCW